mmetsp:Transcript_29230/g.44202  ORF Transcript_29230/g.44202 Transcript_29230/m.44202 type:complete len:2074 (+) Transcript_29230:226-6447(+)
MGCSHSKQDASITDANHKAKQSSTNKRNIEKKGKQRDDTEKRLSRGKNQNASTKHEKAAKRNSSGGAKIDTAWRHVWDSLQSHILDPCDVRAVIESCMAQYINLLTNSEMLLLQRRVRNVVRLLPRLNSQNATQKLMMNRFVKNAVTYANGHSNGNDMSNLMESRATIEKFHQVDEATFKRIFRAGNVLKGDVEFVDPLESLFIIGSYLSSEHILARAASIAIDSSKDLVLDVNKNRPTSPPAPAPVSLKEYLPSEPIEVEGVSFQALAYLIALALRGTREQRLQLLFFISLSPKSLKGFMNSHPAGGLPTWMLEVGNDDIISVASLTHYYYFGRTFCPNGLSQSSKKKKKFTVNAKAVIEWTSNILKATKASDEIGGNTLIATESVASSDGGNNASGTRTKRRGSDSKSNASDSLLDASNIVPDVPSTDLMLRLADVREGRRSVGDSLNIGSDDENYSPDDSESDSASELWTMDMFVKWADDALDNFALHTIFFRLVGAGIFPSPEIERDLVKEAWREWQTTDIRLWSDSEGNIKDSLEYLSKSVQGFFHIKSQPEDTGPQVASLAWGNIGGFDGKGGLGHGLMYCIHKKWWDSWELYTGWSWDREAATSCAFDDRPHDMSNEKLLDRYSKDAVAGTLGSYEIMKSNVRKDIDYILVPPKVWDILYEMYGGGPPLPRMVLPPKRLDIFSAARARTVSGDSKTMEAEDGLASEVGVQVLDGDLKLMRIPEAFTVATHPWVFQCTLCDASQPYRRGDVGSISIRVMATPDQPLWRLYAEILVRLPIQNPRAVGTDGRGKARLWKRIDVTNTKDAISRYGPWTLLCKNRSALLPLVDLDVELEDNFEKLKTDWQGFTDHSTVEGCGLVNGDGLMFEYAVQNKNGEFTWPREAAAKAGRVKRIAEEDAKFKLSIRGFDGSGNIIKNPNNLIDMAVDAMDSSGRWYQVNIIEVERFKPGDEGEGIEEEETECGESQNNVKRKPGEISVVKVDFTDAGGHVEWINVASDRLALPGRFTANSKGENCTLNKSNPTNGADQKAKTGLGGKKATNETTDVNTGKICTFPGYGACGLANLGNTCYANSAIQCISYMPLLRSYLLSGQYRANGDLNKDNPLGTGGKLLEEFAELLRVMWSGKFGERSPTRFRAQLGKQRTQFSGADQQDAQELLNYMLDVLHEDSNKVKKKPFVEAPEDTWVKLNSLPRVGEESWRRFLRRNRSIMADVAMGQVLNTVTCPTCQFSSRNFDPFNLLSIPFPTVAEVMFECTVIRRGTPLNAPKVLNTPRKNKDETKRYKIDGIVERLDPPSEQLILEKYIVPMSRLADIGDLRLRIQNLCGIPSSRLRLCKAETIVNRKDLDDKNPVKYHTNVTSLPDKEGPCVQVAKQSSSSVSSDTSSEDTENPPPTQILAFENTLSLRPMQAADDKNDEEDEETVTDEEEDEEGSAAEKNGGARAAKEIRMLHDLLSVYGDGKECRIYDTNPLPLSKAMSRSLWPQSSKEFKLGLRVDAIDHRDLGWFPGSIVEIIEGVSGENGDTSSSNQNEKGHDQATKTKVRIHFDNFSSKWDETYTIEHFKRRKVRPLYSHAIPRPKPTEFMVHHRYVNKGSNTSYLFGLPFHLQCHNEWSTARAGAHILAQVSRYMQTANVDHAGPISVDDIQEVDSRTLRLYERAYSTISELIDLLLEYDRTYIRSALLDSTNLKSTDKFFRNPTFDATTLSSSLVKKVGDLLRRLPFELKVCTAESLKSGAGSKSKNSAANSTTATEEVNFPFSLMRTIGNYMNARHAVVLIWRDTPQSDKKSLQSSVRPSTLYLKPIVGVHKSSSELLEEQGSQKSKSDTGSAGLHLGICLAEFCKVNKLDLNDNWKCPRCKDFREGKQNMTLWRLPDLLTFHIKRFNCSARWREKIMTKVNFPLTGLDMSEWCHPESPALDGSTDQAVYDLIAVVNHYGGMTGGHYVATCKATPCGPFGSEEVAFQFNGEGVSCQAMDGYDEEDEAVRSGLGAGWTALRRKEKDSANQQKLTATLAARQVCESAEPLWLQFDDDLVEPISPQKVVSEMAYVLFYRRRRLTQSNVAKYSTLE